jgi:DNA uptake protein ComE-like DNA-binding protein
MHIIIRLINWVKQKIRDECGFTYGETMGMLVLLLFMSMALATPLFIKWYNKKYNYPKYDLDLDLDLALLNSTLSSLQAQQKKKDLATTKSKHAVALNNWPNKKKGILDDVKKVPPAALATTKATNAPVYKSFDINTATPEALQMLPGIGQKLATRIIKYNHCLGGFVAQNQYKEVYGLGPLGLQNLLRYTYILADFRPKQLSINQDDFKTLLRHPYLSFEEVKKIIQYRERNGPFKCIEELLHKGIIDSNTFEKLSVYVTL